MEPQRTPSCAKSCQPDRTVPDPRSRSLRTDLLGSYDTSTRVGLCVTDAGRRQRRMQPGTCQAKVLVLGPTRCGARVRYDPFTCTHIAYRGRRFVRERRLRGVYDCRSFALCLFRPSFAARLQQHQRVKPTRTPNVPRVNDSSCRQNARGQLSRRSRPHPRPRSIQPHAGATARTG